MSSPPLREEHRAGIHSPALVRVFPFAIFIALLAFESLVGDRFGDARWLTALRPIVVACVLALLWKHYTELRQLRIARRHAFLAIALGIGVFATWVLFDRGWAVVPSGRTGFSPVSGDRIDATLLALRFLGFALVVPVMEELFWRSFLLRWIHDPRDFLSVDPRAVGFGAFAITSALFAIEHSSWFAGLVAGMAYNLCYMRTRNLWACVLSHAITNTTLGAWILATGQWRLW